MSQFFPSRASMSSPIDRLPIGFNTDITQRIESYYKAKELEASWQKIVDTKRHSEIHAFFNKHESSFLCSGSWYLFALIKGNHIESLQYVLSKTKSFHINTPFTYCIVSRYRNFSPLQVACCESNFDTIKLLLSKGSDVKSETNHRILNLLFQHNQCIDPLNVIPCIHHLVSCGAKVHKDCIYYLVRYYNTHKDDQQQQSLTEREAESYFDIVSLANYLFMNGADINYIATALDRGYFDLAQFMMDNGAHFDDNILRYVLRKQSFVWLFSNNYIRDINHNNRYNGTALFYHTEKNHYNAVKVLLSYNADINVRCKHSKLTAIEVAMYAGNHDLVQLLYKPALLSKRTPALLQDIQCNNFEALPTNPMQLKQMLIDCQMADDDEEDSEDQMENETKSVSVDMSEKAEIETECALVEKNITDLFHKLRCEYDKLLKLQLARNQSKLAMKYNQNKLKLWDDFEALWIYWDIRCFVEWLKRIQFESVQSFYAYWQSDQHCIDHIENYITSNPNRFGIENQVENGLPSGSLFQCNSNSPPLTFSPPSSANKYRLKKRQHDGLQSSRSQPALVASHRQKFLDSLKLGSARSNPAMRPNKSADDVESEKEEEKQMEEERETKRKREIFKGEHLQYFDRYILDKIGIRNELDCDIVFSEIGRLKRKYPQQTEKTEEMENEMDGQCNVCCERETSHILQCGHPFCEFCIDEIRKTTNRCAICKAKITLVIKMY